MSEKEYHRAIPPYLSSEQFNAKPQPGFICDSIMDACKEPFLLLSLF